jgi:hypothetical protein
MSKLTGSLDLTPRSPQLATGKGVPMAGWPRR